MTGRKLRLILPFLVSGLIFSGAVVAFLYLSPQPQDPVDSVIENAPVAALRLAVTANGLYAVRAADIVASGLVESVDFSTVALSRDGRSIPYTLHNDNGDALLLFYGVAPESAAAAPSIYLLKRGDGNEIRRYRAASGAPAGTLQYLTRHWEENRNFLPQSEGDDSWLGVYLFGPTSHEVTLDNIAPSAGDGLITLRFWSNNKSPVDPDHHVVVSLNGRTLGDHYWDGIRQTTVTMTVPAGTLVAGDNTLTIDVPNDTGAVGDALYLDWISLRYPPAGDTLESAATAISLLSDGDDIAIGDPGVSTLVLDVTNPEVPRLIAPETRSGATVFPLPRSRARRYHIALAAAALTPDISVAPRWAHSLRAPDRAADYIAILPADPAFELALEPLLAHRRENGLRTAVVTLPQIYDEFGYGRAAPEAIRQFLGHAYDSWAAPAPRFVLLTGDASYDPHGLSPTAVNRDIVPTALQFTNFAGNVASDTWFTIFEPGSLAPQMAIGRFPAQTVAQLETMVAKTLAYENAGGGDAREHALLVADDEIAFDRANDRLARDLESGGYQTVKLYMSENEDIHDAIVNTFNSGVGVVNYVGHGGVKVWADEVVFAAEDAGKLQNGARLPIFTTFTCLNGYFNHPEIDALAETLLWAEDGGIVAAVAPSGRSLTTQQEPIANAFYAHLLDEDAPTLGEALMIAKVASAGIPDQGEVIYTFNLLGDPALRFQRPDSRG